METSWISIFGAITGTLSLLIHGRRYYQERPKLAPVQLSDEPNYFFYSRTSIDSSKPYEALVGVRIDNVSNTPISVSGFELSIDDYGVFSSTRQSKFDYEYDLYILTNSSFNGGKEYIFKDTILASQMLPAFTLPQYGTIIGIVRFPELPKFVQKSINADFHVITPRGKFSCEVSLSYCHTD